MTTLASLVIKLITDVSEFEAGMKNATKKLDNIGKEMKQVGDKLTMGVTVPVLAAGGASVKMASDLGESLNKVQVVFGDSSKAVTDFSKKASGSMGLSTNSALQAAGTFGNLFTSMQIGQGESATMSMGLVQLAADLASFNNLNVEDVFEKLQSGMVGQSEPLRALGVNLSETAVQAKAMQMGLKASAKELTEQDKITARYAIIMEQTKNAQGDFARTSDGLANSSRIASAQIQDLGASFGESLIPAAISFMQAVTPVLQWFNSLDPATKTTIVNFLMVAAAIGPVVSAAGSLVSGFAALSGLFGAGGALAAIGPWITAVLIPALSGAATWLVGTLGVAFAAVSLPVWGLIAAIGALIAVVIIFGQDAWNTVLIIVELFKVLPLYIAIELDKAVQNFRTWFSEIAELAKSKVSEFFTIGQQLMEGLRLGIIGKVEEIARAAGAAIQAIINAAWKALDLGSPSKVFRRIGEYTMLGLELGIKDNTGLVEKAVTKATSFPTPVLNFAGASAGVGGYGPREAAYQGAGRDVRIQMDNTVTNALDIENLAYRVAEVIKRRQA